MPSTSPWQYGDNGMPLPPSLSRAVGICTLLLTMVVWKVWRHVDLWIYHHHFVYDATTEIDESLLAVAPRRHAALPVPAKENSHNNQELSQTAYFFLHVGPAKTGTTTLQQGLVKLNDTLWREDRLVYHYLSEAPKELLLAMTQPSCRKEVASTYRNYTVTNERIPQCLESLVGYVKHLQARFQSDSEKPISFLYSNEDLSTGTKQPSWDFSSLQIAFRRLLNLQLVVVVSYRRYTDWLFSTHQHNARWTGRKPAWRAWPGTTGRRQVRDPIAGRVLPFVETALQFAPQAGRHRLFPFFYVDQILAGIPRTIPVRIFDLHAHENHPTAHFLCRVLSYNVTPYSCQLASSDAGTRVGRLNTAGGSGSVAQDAGAGPTLIQYDLLVVAAKEAGRLGVQSTGLTRRQAGLWARYWHQTVLNGTDWPSWICPNTTQLEALANFAWTYEENMRMDDQSVMRYHSPQELLPPLDRVSWKSSWDAMVPQWCLINTTAVLGNVTWGPLWELLNDPALPSTPPMK
jgi:hypothetical protein